MDYKKLSIFALLCICLAVTGCVARKSQSSGNAPQTPPQTLPQASQDAPAVQGPLPTIITTPGQENLNLCSLELVKPAQGTVYSDYGMRKDPKAKKKKFHNGIDIAAKRGSEVVAAAPGTVVFTGKKRGYGNTVEITHGNGLITRYAHLDKILVAQGQSVSPATNLGLVGRTGRTTGANLHFELLAQGKSVNPIPESGWKDAKEETAHRL